MHLALLFCVFQAQMLSAEEQAKLSSIEEQAQTLSAHGWFRTADADHDGSLSHQELVEIAKARQNAALEKLRLSDFRIFYASKPLDAIDLDRDGSVSEVEFMATVREHDVADTDGDGTPGHSAISRLSDDEHAELKRFDMADLNGDRSLTAVEYHLLLHPELAPRHEPRLLRAESDNIMVEADASGDELLSFTEYWNFIASSADDMGSGTEDLYHAIFTRHDQEGDGLLGDEEIFALHREATALPLAKHADALIAALDKNDSGQLSWDEVQQYPAELDRYIRQFDDIDYQDWHQDPDVPHAGRQQLHVPHSEL